jgi:dipeptidyl aminopeptidase/acylaminoacyl peptidase
MFNRVLSACLFTAGLCCLAAEAQTLPPVEAFGNLPLVSDPMLSPDAAHFALIQSVNGRPAAVIYSTSGGKPAIVTSGEGLIESVRWAKNDRLVVIAKQGLTPSFDKLHTWHRAFAVDVNGGNLAKLLRNIPTLGLVTNGAGIIDVNLADPDNILMPIWLQSYDVIKVDVHTGKGTVEKTGDSTTIGWIADGNGKLVVKFSETQNPLREHVTVQRDGRWVEIGAYDATGDNDSGISGLTEDGKSLIQTVRNNESFQGLNIIDIATGTPAPILFVPGHDIEGVINDPWTLRAIGASFVDGTLKHRYFNSQNQALQNGIEDAFPGSTVRIVSWDASKTNVVFGVESPRQPTQYFLLNRGTHQTSMLSGTYPSLKPTDLGEMKPYAYKARDNLDIPAFIVTPPGKALKNLPVVVMPHGGPDSHDFIQFDWMAQFLANRGYLVFQPNFRGSSGYGHKFTEAGLQQWGLKMQDDITDGVRKLMIDGIADPKRICIVGGSYGGYAALAGAAFTPDLYACAVSWAGVSDLPVQLRKVMEDAGGRNTELASFWISRMGDNLTQLAATSPSHYADRIRCPILLLHGVNDTTVRIEQSKLMADALKQAGKPFEFVTYEGEDHYLELASTRIRVLTEMERFLKQHIGN